MPTPRHKPTEVSRAIVKALAGFGIKQDEIAKHPEVSISPPTLLKHYRQELDEGNVAAQGKIGEALFDEAVNKRNIAGLIFLAKCRLGFKEVIRTEQTGADGGPIQVEGVAASAAAVIAILKAKIGPDDAK